MQTSGKDPSIAAEISQIATVGLEYFEQCEVTLADVVSETFRPLHTPGDYYWSRIPIDLKAKAESIAQRTVIHSSKPI